MSLSFVSKTVQTATESGGFEEKQIEGKEDSTSYDATAKPLFEQLRANQEQEDAEREEQQRAIMIGTTEFNEEDKAHLDALDRQKQMEETEKQRETQEALAAFRAAQADQREQSEVRVPPPPSTTVNEGRDSGNQPRVQSDGIQKDTPNPLLFIRKKRKRNIDEVDASTSTKNKQVTNKEQTTSIEHSESNTKPLEKTDDGAKPEKEGGSGTLGGLLTAYESSDDE